MSKVVIQDQGRGDTPYEVYELDDNGDVVTTLGAYETVDEAKTEAEAYAAAGDLEVDNQVAVDTNVLPDVVDVPSVDVPSVDAPVVDVPTVDTPTAPLDMPGTHPLVPSTDTTPEEVA